MRLTRGPVIIVEGPDGGGKTTLAHELQAAWNHHGLRQAVGWDGPLTYLHQGPYRGDPLPETIRLLERRAHRGAVICDRLHLGEQVYGPIYRGRDALGDAGRRMLERYLLARNAVVILALPTYAVARAAWFDRTLHGDEMFPDEAGYGRVYAGFQEIKTWLPLRHYDHVGDDVVELISWVARQATKPARRTLIVGEAPGGWQTAGVPPFCARGGCSEWLAEQLDAAGVNEARLAWVNARDRRGRARRPDVITDLARAGRLGPVVALGRVADAWARRYVTPVRAVAHPQYHKRFHHGEPYPLLEVLRAIT